jgi:hypothetical protein
MPRLPRLLLTLLMLSLLGISGAAWADGAGPRLDPTRFLGSYGFAGGEQEARSLKGTVDDLVERFNPLLRGLARRRLERSVRVPERIEIRAGDAGIRLEVVGAPDFPHDARYEHGALVLRQSSFEGKRETRFQLSDDGGRLTMHVTTHSHLLPDLLDYELTFRRTPDDLAASATAVSTGPPGS